MFDFSLYQGLSFVKLIKCQAVGPKFIQLLFFFFRTYGFAVHYFNRATNLSFLMKHLITPGNPHTTASHNTSKAQGVYLLQPECMFLSRLSSTIFKYLLLSLPLRQAWIHIEKKRSQEYMAVSDNATSTKLSTGQLSSTMPAKCKILHVDHDMLSQY